VKAIVGTSYGTPDRLRLDDVEGPTIGEKDVLVRVHAASVNALDWHMATGMPMVLRLKTGLSRPKRTIRGVDVAGVVEKVGSVVTRFKPGDEVFGLGSGSFAEYASADESELQHKPEGLSFVDAAALPVAGITALQGLQRGGVHAGLRMLVLGAGGGVGAFVVQMAAAAGALVTGVCSTSKVDFVRSLGASTVLDRSRDDFSRKATTYDLVVDAVGVRSLRSLRRLLTKQGTLVLLGGGASGFSVLGPLPKMAAANVIDHFIKQQIVLMMAKVTPESLDELAAMYGAEKLKVPIDRTVSLPETPEAINRLYTGHGRGKTVVLVSE